MNKVDTPGRSCAPTFELLTYLHAFLRNEGYLVQESGDRQGLKHSM